jgi:hypothetical protein
MPSGLNVAPASEPTPAVQARGVIARTASVWRIEPASPRAVARRAPHGDVPIRALRRIHGAGPASLAMTP